MEKINAFIPYSLSKFAGVDICLVHMQLGNVESSDEKESTRIMESLT